MCGIAGVLTADHANGAWLRDVTVRMTQRIAHRGPDHDAVWSDGARAAIGYRRLAIVDLSPEGHQPRFAHGGRLAMVFNGEIYNFVELREELEAAGVGFRGHSDTEVLLAAIDAWGFEPALTRAAGMFALAMWDADAGSLYLARDRAGKKPLYYAQAGGVLFFASEIKALRDGAGLALTEDHEALHHYLSLGYIPGTRTAYREIREVPPGSWASVRPGEAPRIARYWSLPAPDEHARIDDVDGTLERLLSTAITQRMRADVDVGVFLSGGIDSGLVATLAARAASRPLTVFTVAFDDAAFDETKPAAAVAARLGARHEIIPLTADARELLPQVAAAYDEPFGDPSAVPTFAVARAASRRLKVVLNGEGADEMFGGYRRHLAMHRLTPLAAVAPYVPGLASVAERLPHPAGFRTPYSLFYRVARGLAASPVDRYIAWSSDGFTESEKRRLMPDATMPSTAETLAAEAGWPLDRGPVADFMGLDFTYNLSDCLLVKMDIATMAHSLEARSPFLDHRLLDWVARLPRRTIFSEPGTKPLLRRLARRLLPDGAASQPKRGFEIPLRRWTTGDVFPMIRETCLDPNGVVLRLMHRRAVTDLIERRWHLDEERWSKRVWSLLMLALWDRESRAARLRLHGPHAIVDDAHDRVAPVRCDSSR
jgi:asparagine synthase (glutamine-hydrolysing)